MVTPAAIAVVADELRLTLPSTLSQEDLLRTLGVAAADYGGSLSDYTKRVLRDLGVLKEDEQTTGCFGKLYSDHNKTCRVCASRVRCQTSRGSGLVRPKSARGHTALAERSNRTAGLNAVRPTALDTIKRKKDDKTERVNVRNAIVDQLVDRGYRHRKATATADEFTLDYGKVIIKAWDAVCKVIVIEATSKEWLASWRIPKGPHGHEWSDLDLDKALSLLNGLLKGKRLIKKES